MASEISFLSIHRPNISHRPIMTKIRLVLNVFLNWAVLKFSRLSGIDCKKLFFEREVALSREFQYSSCIIQEKKTKNLYSNILAVEMDRPFWDLVHFYPKNIENNKSAWRAFLMEFSTITMVKLLLKLSRLAVLRFIHLQCILLLSFMKLSIIFWYYQELVG